MRQPVTDPVNAKLDSVLPPGPEASDQICRYGYIVIGAQRLLQIYEAREIFLCPAIRPKAAEKFGSVSQLLYTNAQPVQVRGSSVPILPSLRALR